MNEAIMLTGNDVYFARLAAAKFAVKMEKLGMKSKGGSMRRAWALHLGLKASAKHDAVIAELERRMADMQAAKLAA